MWYRLIHSDTKRGEPAASCQLPQALDGQTISAIGSEITFVALPLTAVLLNASAMRMGILTAAGMLPCLLLGLPVGAWVDHLPVLFAADVSRAVLLATIPVATMLRILRIEQLYLVHFLADVGMLFYQAAEQAFLPSLVEWEQLVQANSGMAATDALARTRHLTKGENMVQCPFGICMPEYVHDSLHRS